MPTTAFYSGSFDPLTNGHFEAVERRPRRRESNQSLRQRDPGVIISVITPFEGSP